MNDTYFLETLMWEHKTKMQRQARLQAALHELEQSRGRNGETVVARLRRVVATLLPIRRTERTATR